METTITKEKLSDEDASEIARRRDDAIRRALNTPPKKLEKYVGVTSKSGEKKKTLSAQAAAKSRSK